MEVWTPNNKHVVYAGHTPVPSTGNESPPTPAMYNPLLAYDRGVLDPSVDPERDEGETRLKLLRPALYMAKKDRPGFTDVEGDASLAALITTSEAAHFAVHASLFKVDAPWKPKVRLIAPTTYTFGAETADSQLPENLRVECIPVKGTDRVCALNWPKERLPPPKLMIDFSKRQLNDKEAFLRIERGEQPDTLSMLIFSDGGARREVTLTGVKQIVIDRLLAPIPVVDAIKPLPKDVGELPVDLQSAVADFWQHQMRCHVVATVCAPGNATRPLAFESVKVTHEGRGHSKLVLRSTLHPSSIQCACKLHGFPPMQERFPSDRFTGSEVDMTLSMCGRKRPRSGAGYGDCPMHGANTPNVSMFPGICCHDTVATMGCSHFIAAGKQKRARRKSGLWISDMGLNGLDLLHAQGLLASASTAEAKLAPMLGKRPRGEILAVCEETETGVERTIDELARMRASDGSVRSDTEMITLDMAAVDALRENKYRRHVRPSTKEEVLAKDQPEGGATPCTKVDADKSKGPPLELAETHLGLFRPPLPKGRRASTS